MEMDGALLVKGTQTQLLWQECGRSGDIGRTSGIGRWSCVTVLLIRPRALLETLLVLVEASGSPVTDVLREKILLDSLPFPCGYRASVSSCAGFVRIRANFSESPCTHTLIAGR